MIILLLVCPPPVFPPLLITIRICLCPVPPPLKCLGSYVPQWVSVLCSLRTMPTLQSSVVLLLLSFLVGLSFSLNPRDPNVCSLWERWGPSDCDKQIHVAVVVSNQNIFSCGAAYILPRVYFTVQQDARGSRHSFVTSWKRKLKRKKTASLWFIHCHLYCRSIIHGFKRITDFHFPWLSMIHNVCLLSFAAASPPRWKSRTRILTTTWQRSPARTRGPPTDARATGRSRLVTHFLLGIASCSCQWGVRASCLTVLFFQDHLQDGLQAGGEDRLPQEVPVLSGLLREQRQMCP